MAVNAAVARAAEHFGRLDALVNNAGVAVFAPVLDTSEEDWTRILAVNLTGPFLCTRAAAPVMREHGGGAIVNNSSNAGLGGSATRAAYSATKHAVLGLTKSAALEYGAAGIRVNAVCPSAIETPMVARMIADGALDPEAAAAAVAIPRLGRAEEVAAAVLWLCSPGSSYVTGVALPVDGGFTAN